MKSIWKYKVEPGEFVIEMPAGADILSVQFQPALGGPQVWALVDPNRPKVQRRFVTVSTGEKCPDQLADLRFVGTFQLPTNLVFHLFDAGEAP